MYSEGIGRGWNERRGAEEGIRMKWRELEGRARSGKGVVSEAGQDDSARLICERRVSGSGGNL